MVTSIGDNAFEDFISIKTVSLPISITSIGTYCFHGCTALSIINLSHVTSIGGWGFLGCSSLQNIYLTSIETLGWSCFEGCSSLINITFSNNLTEIPGWAFEGCTSIDVLTIPNSVTSIATSCFKNCNKLTSLSLGDGVTSIGTNAFYGCALVDVFMPPQLTIDNIGDGAFLGQSDETIFRISNEYLNQSTDSDNTFQDKFQTTFKTKNYSSWFPYYIFDTDEGNRQFNK